MIPLVNLFLFDHLISSKSVDASSLSNLSLSESFKFKDKKRNSIHTSRKSSIKWRHYDLERTRRVNQVLHEIYQIPTFSRFDSLSFMSEMIQDYDFHDDSFKCLYEKIIKELKMSEFEWENLNFPNRNFIKNLDAFLNDKKLNLTPNHIFWADFGRFLFKFMIHRKQETVDNLEEFRKTILDLDSLISRISRKENFQFGFDFNSEFGIKFHPIQFKQLMTLEFFENPQIFPLFASIIEYFYPIDQKSLKKIKCKELKFKYFDGNFSNDPVLKYLIIMSDPKGRLRKCIIKEDFQIYDLSPYSEIDINQEYLYELRIKGPNNLQISILSHINKSIIEFYLSRGKRFKVGCISDFLYLIKRLRENEEFFTRSIIERIVDLKNDRNEWIGWNLDLFLKSINNLKRYYGLSKEEISNFDACLELFKGSSLISILFEFLGIA